MVINQKALDMVKSFEGLRLRAYQDLGGTWSVGFGSTRGVRAGMVITPQQAEDLLQGDLKQIQEVLNKLILVPLNENQMAACISLAYNIGIRAFTQSTLMKKLNMEDYMGASKEFVRWAHVKGTYLPALEKRRLAEKAVFNQAVLS